MTTLYRIHTELRPNLAELAARFFPGFTLLTGIGYWEGLAEPTAILELYGTADDAALVATLAETIRVANRQHSVLVVVVTLARSFSAEG
jgi:hypothetical protein